MRANPRFLFFFRSLKVIIREVYKKGAQGEIIERRDKNIPLCLTDFSFLLLRFELDEIECQPRYAKKHDVLSMCLHEYGSRKTRGQVECKKVTLDYLMNAKFVGPQVNELDGF